LAYKGFFPVPGIIKELKRSRVIELAPDVWMLEGFLGDQFLTAPPSSNIYILRDGDTLVLLDTGTYPFYRETIKKIIRRYKNEGIKRLILMLTQGHFDHVANNDVILEAGIEDVRFLLPEPEVPVIDLRGHWLGDFKKLEEYYNPYSFFPLDPLTAPIRAAGVVSQGLARSLLKTSFSVLFRGIRTLVERAEILTLESRKKKTFGDVELMGWEVGRFFAVHDATHSPGHLSLYDPENKLLLTGDATLEINPAFFYSSIDRCIEMSAKFMSMAEQDFIRLAADSHRSSIFMPSLFEKYGAEPLAPVQVADMAQGKDECVTFYALFESYYTQLKDETLTALNRLGSATVAEVVEELEGSTNPSVTLKKGLRFPNFPSRMDVLAATVLKEAGIKPRKEGSRIVFVGTGGQAGG